MVIAGGDDLLDRPRLDTIAEGLPIRSVSISQQKARRGVPGESLGDLASQPALCRVLGDIEMDDFSPLMAEDDQRIEQLKPCRYDNEHVDGGCVMAVIVQERAPGRGGALGRHERYLPTVAWLTSMPSLSSSPWMRGAPQSGFAWLIWRIRSRISRLILGRPRGRDRRHQ